MSNQHTAADVSHLAAFDTDGALQDAAERVNHATRRGFLRGAGALIGGGVVLSAFPGGAMAATPKGDVAILNYALTLEYLESAFYKEANAKGALSGEVARFAKTVGAHEDAHVTALKKALGSAAVKKPNFDFQGTTESQATFSKTAIVLEDTGVMAYQGQAPNIKTPAILRAAISIHPVEARHAAWIRNITSGNPPAPDAFNPAADMATVLAAVKGTGFITTMGAAASGGSVSGTPAMTG
jgi:Ferritin-like domain